MLFFNKGKDYYISARWFALIIGKTPWRPIRCAAIVVVEILGVLIYIWVFTKNS